MFSSPVEAAFILVVVFGSSFGAGCQCEVEGRGDDGD